MVTEGSTETMAEKKELSSAALAVAKQVFGMGSGDGAALWRWST
jgi:hypothetical protein